MADVIQFTFEGNASGLLGAIGQSEAGLGRLEGSATKAGAGLQTALGVGVVAAAAGLGAALTGAVSAATDFEKQISGIAAVSGEGAAGIDQIRQTALQLGKDTSFSASQAAAGMEEIVKAGLSVQQVVGGAGRAVLDLSAASGTAVDESARIMSNVLNAFATDQMTAGQAADLLTGAANASATSVHELGYGLASVGAVAATMGLSFKDTNDALALFAQNGLKGSDAGTSLKTMLLNLTPSTKKQNEEMRALGIITADGANQFFDATGKVKSLADIAGVLQTATKDLTQEQKIQALQTIFGTDAIRAAAIMAKEGAAGFNEMDAAVVKQGNAQGVANQRLDNLAGSIEKLKGSVETGAIVLGSMFTPALKSLADMVTGEVNQAVDILQQLPDVVTTIQEVLAGDWSSDASIQPFTNAVGLLTIQFRDNLLPAILPVVTALQGAFATAMTFVTDHAEAFQGALIGIGAALVGLVAVGGILALTAAITALLSPIGLLVVAAGVLGAAWAEDWGGIREITATVVAWLQQNIPIVIATIIDISRALAQTDEAFTAWVTSTVAAITTWVTDTTTAIVTWATDTVTAFTDWASSVEAAITGAWAALTEAFTAGIAAVQAIWQAGWDALAGIATAAWSLLSTENQTKVTELVTLITTLWQLLPALWTAGTALVTTTVTAWWAALVALWTTETTAVTTATTTWWETTTALWTTATAAITALVTTWWAAITAAWTTATAAITAIVGPWWAAIQALWQQAHDAIVAGVTAFFKAVGDAWTSATTTLSGIAASLGTAIMDALLGALNAAAGAVIDSVIGTVRKAIDGARSLISGFGGGTTGVAGATGGGDYDAKAIAAARRHGLEDPTGFAAQLRQESGNYDPEVVSGRRKSSAGAAGIAQFMPGTAARYGIDPNDPDASIEAAAQYMADLKGQYGSQQEAAAHYYGATGANSQEGRYYLNAVENQRKNVRMPSASVPQVSQFALGLPPDEAMAACGPAALAWFMNQTGRTPTGQQAEQLAAASGWDKQRGMYGPAAFGNALTGAGISNVVDTTPTRGEVGALAAAGTPFAISTSGTTDEFGQSRPGHYFQVQGGSPEGLNVGLSGTALKGGSSIMSLDQITAMTGPMNAIITLSGQMGDALTTAGTVGGAAFDGLLASATTMADGSTLTITQMGTDVTATVTDAAGQVTGQWTTMATGITDQTAALATGVPEQTAAMASGVLTSVTDLGGGVLTTMQDMSGTTIATVTDMTGQVTSQSATLASGVSVNMADMSTQATASVDAMTGNITTVVTDAMGNAVTTVTTASGQVVSQFATMSTQAGSAVSQLAATSKTQFGAVGSAAAATHGPITAVDTDMASIEPPDLSSSIAEFKRLQKAAEAAADAIRAVHQGGEKSGEGDSSKFGKNAKGGGFKAAGGPVSALSSYLVGEQGPELFVPYTNGTIIPNNRLSGGGGGTTIVINVNVAGSVTSERDLVEAVRDGLIGIGRRNASDVLSGGGGS